LFDAIRRSPDAKRCVGRDRHDVRRHHQADGWVVVKGFGWSGEAVALRCHGGRPVRSGLSPVQSASAVFSRSEALVLSLSTKTTSRTPGHSCSTMEQFRGRHPCRRRPRPHPIARSPATIGKSTVTDRPQNDCRDPVALIPGPNVPTSAVLTKVIGQHAARRQRGCLSSSKAVLDVGERSDVGKAGGPCLKDLRPRLDHRVRS
jgi:hypothetical protein